MLSGLPVRAVIFSLGRETDFKSDAGIVAQGVGHLWGYHAVFEKSERILVQRLVFAVGCSGGKEFWHCTAATKLCLIKWGLPVLCFQRIPPFSNGPLPDSVKGVLGRRCFLTAPRPIGTGSDEILRGTLNAPRVGLRHAQSCVLSRAPEPRNFFSVNSTGVEKSVRRLGIEIMVSC